MSENEQLAMLIIGVYLEELGKIPEEIALECGEELNLEKFKPAIHRAIHEAIERGASRLEEKLGAPKTPREDDV